MPQIDERYESNVFDDIYTPAITIYYPTITSYFGHTHAPHIPRYNIHKVDWERLCQYTIQIPPFPFIQDHNHTCDFFTKFITNAANKAIPLSSPNPSTASIPWWSLKSLVKIKHYVGRRLGCCNRRLQTLLNRQSMTDDTVSKLGPIAVIVNNHIFILQVSSKISERGPPRTDPFLEKVCIHYLL